MAEGKNRGIQSLSVLIIDDDRDILELMKDILKRLGFNKIQTSTNADRALEIVSASEIDLVICDWRMPGMSGLEFTRHIRNLALSRNTFLNIIMLTGNAELKNITEARDAGVTEYLIKPFTVKDFCNKIFEVIENPREFVISDRFKGPSRRRKEGTPPDGIEKRRPRS